MTIQEKHWKKSKVIMEKTLEKSMQNLGLEKLCKSNEK